MNTSTLTIYLMINDLKIHLVLKTKHIWEELYIIKPWLQLTSESVKIGKWKLYYFISLAIQNHSNRLCRDFHIKSEQKITSKKWDSTKSTSFVFKTVLNHDYSYITSIIPFSSHHLKLVLYSNRCIEDTSQTST